MRCNTIISRRNGLYRRRKINYCKSIVSYPARFCCYAFNFPVFNVIFILLIFLYQMFYAGPCYCQNSGVELILSELVTKSAEPISLGFFAFNGKYYAIVSLFWFCYRRRYCFWFFCFRH